MKESRIWIFLKANRAALFYSFIAGVFLLFPLIMGPIFKRVFTDSILIDGATEWLGPLLLLMGGIAVFSALATWLQKNCLLRLANKIELSGAASYMWRLFNAPPELFRHKDSFALLSGSEASSLIARTLTVDILSLFPVTVSVIFYFGIMFHKDAALSLIVLGLAAINLLGQKIQSLLENFFSRSSPNPYSLRNLDLQDAQISSRGLRNIEIYKATASENLFFQQMMSSKIRIINDRGKNDEAEASAPFSNLPEIFFLNLLLLISALRIMNRELSVGSYLEFQAYAAAFFYPMSQVLSIPALFSRLEDRLQSLYQELETGIAPAEAVPEVSASPAPVSAPALVPDKLRGYVEFREVCFSYSEGAPLLDRFSLSLKPGERAAIVGKSGSGKSTVVKLLQGFYRPDSGELTIDGLSPDRISRDIFTASIGSANQKISFFTASIRDNITLWDDTVSDAAVYRVVREVGLHSFVSSLEGGYDHILEENGCILSGGQQQRMELARALVYNPSILILDEINGAIDPGMIREIEGHFKRRGCTILQTTQILSPVLDYDEIILLDNGRIADRGTHSELLKTSPWYAALFRMGETR